MYLKFSPESSRRKETPFTSRTSPPNTNIWIRTSSLRLLRLVPTLLWSGMSRFRCWIPGGDISCPAASSSSSWTQQNRRSSAPSPAGEKSSGPVPQRRGRRFCFWGSGSILKSRSDHLVQEELRTGCTSPERRRVDRGACTRREFTKKNKKINKQTNK